MVIVLHTGDWSDEMKKNLFNIDYNKPSKAYNSCASEYKKINKKINNRKLSEIKNEEVIYPKNF